MLKKVKGLVRLVTIQIVNNFASRAEHDQIHCHHHLILSTLASNLFEHNHPQVSHSMPTITLPDLLNHSSSLSVPNSARLQSLYTFTSSQRLSNVAGYEANIRWWAGVLKECMREGLSGGDRLLLRVDEIVGKLEWNSTLGAGTVLSRPKGFGGVLVSETRSFDPRGRR